LISRFFINRPIFASVLSIGITLVGAITLYRLPLAQYPQVTPPVVQVDCKYPGASAQVLAEAVAAPIEQQVNGVENMLYMSSQCNNDGTYNLRITFQIGTDPNVAWVQVQNRVNLALPVLPVVIKQAGVPTRKRSPDTLMAIALTSPDDRYDQLYLSNYALIHIKDELARVPGVSDVRMQNRDYSMRIWLDPELLAARNMTVADIVNAIREQNAPVACGQIGQQPNSPSLQIQMPVSTLGRLSDVKQFEEIIVKCGPDHQLVRLKDVARVELGAKSQDVSMRVDGRQAISLTIYALPNANALATADAVKAKMAELAKLFPDGLRHEIRYDTTPFIRESIHGVVNTLQESVVLVALVVLLFLQNWRSAVIPLLAVPVSLIGTFTVLGALGFSLNTLTLFGLVLAVGIVVDDAIVVVEAVEYHIERGLSPRNATLCAMDEVTGPVIAILLVLTAVFVPCAFVSGIIGQFFRQFAVAIATSTIISAFNSLTLSPALATLLLRRCPQGRVETLPRLAFILVGGWLGWSFAGPCLPSLVESLHAPLGQWVSQPKAFSWFVRSVGVLLGLLLGWLAARPLNRVLGKGFALFNAALARTTDGYIRVVGSLLRIGFLVLIVYGGLLYLTYWGFTSIPRGFIPAQDLGYLLVEAQLPDAASLERTEKVMVKLEQICHETKGVRHTQVISGESMTLGTYIANFGSIWVSLDEIGQRRTLDLSAETIANDLRRQFAEQVPEANVTVSLPPPVPGVGNASGFKLMVEDRGNVGLRALREQTQTLTEQAGQQPDLAGLSSVLSANVPQIFVDFDRASAMTRGVDMKELSDALQVNFGSLYVNDFNRFGRTWQVNVQAGGEFRRTIEDVMRLKVRNRSGQMVPLGSVAQVRETSGPLILTRYNMYPAAPIRGNSAPGTSTGQAIALMERLAREQLPSDLAVEWTEMAYLEIQAGNTASILFAFAAVMVFLVLAAQYESWALPLAVILVVPMCLLSAILGVYLAGQDLSIFTQIGSVVLVGLASKNAILIVECARRKCEAGVSRREAVLAACRLRLRPIVMTSLAFILGVLPLAFASGAGAEMQWSLGVTVFGGMLGVTCFGLLFTPVFFDLIDGLSTTRPFNMPLMQRISRAILGIFALTAVRRLLWGRLLRPTVARIAHSAITTPTTTPPTVPVSVLPEPGQKSGIDIGTGISHSESQRCCEEEFLPTTNTGE
jgi:multidrug efflux pump